ncbi:glycosyltransferase family 39 protein [Kitasatospora sp. NPDC056138]|uniref:glycosyltransferase family 39 protein n=1 Tax=Kitasatospora sp. NPDC056138 TaxID=3345724 RepID=UPI0035DEE191
MTTDKPPTPDRRWPVVLPPALLTLLLGLWGIERGGSIWRDEAVSYQVAHRSLPEIWRMLHGIDAVHGLHYLLLHTVFRFWDGGLLALRLPSVLAMVLAAAALAEIGRRLAGPRAGLLAGLVFALVPAVQQYAQEGRSYASVCAAVVVGSLLLVRAWQRPGASAWAAYGAVMLLGTLLHEFAVLVVAGHAVTLWWGRAGRRVWRGWAVTTAIVLAGLLPLVLISRAQADQVAWIRPPDWSDIWAPALTSAVGALCACLRQPAVPGAALRLRVLALPLLVLPPVVLILVSYLDPLYVDRYVVFSYAGLALLLGLALDRGWARLPRALTRWPTAGRPVVAALALSALVLAPLPLERGLRTPQSRPNDVAAAARAARDLGRPGDAVLFVPGARREAALYDPSAFAALADVALDRSGADSGTINGVEAAPERIRAALATVHRVVLVTDPRPRAGASARDRAKLAVLAARFGPCRSTAVRGITVTLYAARGSCG